MALRREAEIGTRVVLDPSPKYAAPTRAYKPGRGKVTDYSTVGDRYTVLLDDGEEITLAGVHLKREDLGYGRRKSRA